MNKIFYFLMVSVAFTGLQVGTVEAADGPPTATQGFSGAHGPQTDGARVDRAHPDDANREAMDLRARNLKHGGQWRQRTWGVIIMHPLTLELARMVTIP